MKDNKIIFEKRIVRNFVVVLCAVEKKIVVENDELLVMYMKATAV